MLKKQKNLTEFNIIIALPTLYYIFKDIRKIIYDYLVKMYQHEKIGELDEHEYFSVEESNIGHKKGRALWLLGIIKNSTKEFRIEANFERDTATIKKFINKFVDKGNTIISNGWSSYNYLDNPDSGYIHVKHIHSAGSFGAGILSTSHIESIWAQIKSKIKETYHIIPNKYIVHYVKGAEFKIGFKNKNTEDCYL